MVVADSNGKTYEVNVAALTNDGDAANEVTLDQAVPSGRVVHVGGAWDFVPAPAGMVLPAGIEITDVTTRVATSTTVTALSKYDSARAVVPSGLMVTERGF